MLTSLFLRMPIRAYSVSLVSMTITTIALMFGIGGNNNKSGDNDDNVPDSFSSSPVTPSPFALVSPSTFPPQFTAAAAVLLQQQQHANNSCPWSEYNNNNNNNGDNWIGHYYTCKLLELVGVTTSSMLNHSKFVAVIIYDTGALVIVLCTIIWLLLLLHVLFVIDISTNPKYIVMFNNWMYLHRGHGIHQNGSMFIQCNCANKDKAPAEHRGIWEYLVDVPSLVFKQYLLKNKIPDIVAWLAETSAVLMRASGYILTSQSFSGLRHMSLFAFLKMVCIAVLWRVGEELYTVVGLPLAVFYYTAVAQYWWNCYTTRRIQQATANTIQAGIPNPFNIITLTSPLQFQQQQQQQQQQQRTPPPLYNNNIFFSANSSSSSSSPQ
jgi:hypothetical protein